ncbi:MAG TPA: LptF/LptG family permease [bacterium]|nr:LptF/LptG family permease [bacterium]
MKVLTRYILREFFRPFWVALGGFSLIFLIVQVFNDIHLLLEFHPGPWLTLKYFFFHIPGFVSQMVPIACLAGVLFSMGGLARGNELIAMRSGGVDIYRIVGPLTLAGAILCLSSLVLSEWIVPRAEQEKHHTVWVEISKHPEDGTLSKRSDFSMAGAGGGVYHIGSFDGATRTMRDFLILDFDGNGNLVSRLDGRQAVYQDGQWVMEDGYHRTFDGSGNETLTERIDRAVLPIPEKPADLLLEQKDPHQLNLLALAAYLKQLERNGADRHKELVIFYQKLATPFGCVVMMLLGIPWGWNARKYTGILAGFGISALVAFLYIGGMQIGEHLGETGSIPPVLGAWGADFLFGSLGLFLMVRKNR